VGHFASGGNGLALFNLDYRYPFLPGFWATVFFDSGNVWQDWRDITLSELKHGVGAGLGWDSPIGPLRLEVGWKLDSESFEDPYEIFLSFGTAF
jgi:outer membrane translocation and assembly module TamA